MAYLGPKPSQTLATPSSQYFNGTGSQTVFTLNRAVNVSEDLEVFVNNIQQEPGVGKSYTASGTTLTFDAAPSSGTANVYVVYRGLAEVTTRLEHDANSALAATTGTFSGSVTMDRLGLGSAAHASAALLLTTTNQHIRLDNGGELGVIELESNGDLNIWAHGDGETLNLKTGSGAGIDVLSVVGNNVGIGTSSPDTDISKFGGSAKGLSVAAGQPAITVRATANSQYVGYFGQASTNTYLGAMGGGSLIIQTGTSGTERMRIDSAGRISINTTAATELLNVAASAGNGAGIEFAGNGTTLGSTSAFYGQGSGSDAYVWNRANNPILFGTNNAEKMRIDSSGNVGIGAIPETTYVQKTTLRLSTTASLIAGTSYYPYPYYIANNLYYDASDNLKYIANSGGALLSVDAHTGGSFSFYTAPAGTAGATASLSQKMRLNTDGRWWVGQAVGTTLNGNGGEAVTGIMSASSTVNSYTVIQSNGSNAPLYVTNGPNRTGNNFIHFGENGSYTGGIGTAGSRLYIADNTQNTGISFYQGCLVPTNINGTVVDNVYDCGHPSYRWDDIRATNGTIQTSDANEKQQIAALTDAEMTAAKAISALFKTFKWNDSVAEKGDAARTHAGVIAQDVQAAMTAAGLDAGDYAFFISDTWWETQTEVPAVEAVDAVDAVYEDVVIPAVEEELDEDGTVIVEAQPERIQNRLVSEAILAVEAVAAYTRTDTYDTAQEAPEGATERTRMGIRYPELLAFIGAATEQRLSNIETRLAALEAN